MNNHIVEQITLANPERNIDTLWRRIMKLSEELGEANEAFLNVTSDVNAKQKTWMDVREELVDLMIVTIDCLMTPLPCDGQTSDAEMEAEIEAVMEEKLEKWRRARHFTAISPSVASRSIAAVRHPQREDGAVLGTERGVGL